MNNDATKKGIQGILYRTKAPKLYEVKPTANAKKMAKMKHIIKKESLANKLSVLKNPRPMKI